MEQRMSLLTLGVADLERSVKFYEALGWTRSGPGEGVAFFQLNGIVLSLYPREHLARDLGIAPFGEGFSGFTPGYNTRTKEDVDLTVAAFAAAGGHIVRKPGEAFWGGYFAFAADPDGHIWEIAWNPGFPMDEKGNILSVG